MASNGAGSSSPSTNPPLSGKPMKPWHRQDGRGFVNPWPSFIDHGVLSYGRARLFDWKYKRLPPPSERAPLVPINKGTLEAPPADGMQLTWLGHATMLLQLGGFNILFDPVFSQRCSPSQMVGPKRITPPGCAITDLPSIHAVVISHNHYDHLDKGTILALGNTPRYFVPLGLTEWFTALGVTNVVEADWWEANELGSGVSVICTPCQHFSGRGIFDRNRTLWASWVVQATGRSFFFGGDTAYRAVPKHVDEATVPTCPVFKEIGDRFGPFDLACIPIGAYSPRWFMSCIHCSPEDAVCVHLDIRSKRSVGMHWGTFVLTDEDVREPPRRLCDEMRRRGIDPARFSVLAIGETIQSTNEHDATGDKNAL